eukprot:jgi/Ulvmu1/2226/UM013_0073.1
MAEEELQAVYAQQLQLAESSSSEEDLVGPSLTTEDALGEAQQLPRAESSGSAAEEDLGASDGCSSSAPECAGGIRPGLQGGLGRAKSRCQQIFTPLVQRH